MRRHQGRLPRVGEMKLKYFNNKYENTRQTNWAGCNRQTIQHLQKF